jgi:hypothetical protein
VCVIAIVWACGSLLYARSGGHPQIRNEDRLPGATTAPAGPDRAILEQHHPGGRSVLRVRADRERQRLWVLTLDNVYVYDTRELALIRRIRLPEWFVADFMCAPDMIVDKSGTAFVSHNVQPRVVQIGGHDFEVKEHQLQLISGKQWEIGFGALAFGPDGTLFALSALAGSLFRIDLGRATATEIEPAQMDAATALNLRAGCSPL